MNQPAFKPRRKFHLPYLDGIRGFAAVYVVLYHAMMQVGDNVPTWISVPTKTLRYGAFSVVVFIVLSGYCLMLPVAQSEKGYISGTLVDYFKRRGRRILPPYYIALILCLLLALTILGLEKFTNFQWRELTYDFFLINFSVKDVILHFLLLHNFTPDDQVWTINSPMWSVAVEWQIYFFFPLLLLPVWRRWGLLSAIGIAFVVGLTPHYLFNGFMDASCPWMLGVFTFGMAAADISFSHKLHLIWLRKSLPWGILAAIFTVVALVTEWNKLGLDGWISQSFIGIAAACFMVYCTNFFIEEKALPKLVGILQSKVAIALGAFSYSLYLTHGPVLTLVRHFLISLQLSGVTFALSLYLLGLGISLLFGYLFYLVFERPFTRTAKHKQKATA